MRLFLLTLLALFIFCQTSHASSIAANSVVYISCEQENGAFRFGTGVVVSDDGDFVTAKHVVGNSKSCKARLSSGSFMPQTAVTVRKSSIHFDAAYLSFVDPVDESIIPLCVRRINSSMRGMPIRALGFPADGTGEISERTGILSTASPNEKGLLETSAITAMQMSGGPVSIDGKAEIIGIVVGANTSNVIGIPQSYEILAADRLLGIFDLTDCSEFDRNAREQEIFSNALQSWSELALDLNTFRIWQETLNHRIGAAMGVIDSMYSIGCFGQIAEFFPPIGTERSQYSVSKNRNAPSEFDRASIDVSRSECQSLLALNDELNNEARLLINRTVAEKYIDGMSNFPRTLQNSILSTNAGSRVSTVILQLKMDSSKNIDEVLEIALKSIDGKVLSELNVGSDQEWEDGSLNTFELDLADPVKLETLILGSINISNNDLDGVPVSDYLDFFISISIVDISGVRFTVKPFSTALNSFRLSRNAAFLLKL